MSETKNGHSPIWSYTTSEKICCMPDTPVSPVWYDYLIPSLSNSLITESMREFP
jgi:hypothetical protein